MYKRHKPGMYKRQFAPEAEQMRDSTSHRLASQISCSTGWHSRNENIAWCPNVPARHAQCVADAPKLSYLNAMNRMIAKPSFWRFPRAGRYLVCDWSTIAEGHLQNSNKNEILAFKTWILALQQIHVSDWFQRNSQFKACLKKLLWLFFHHQASRIGSIAAKVVKSYLQCGGTPPKHFELKQPSQFEVFFPRMLAWSRSLKTDPVPCSSYNSSVLRILPCRQRQQGIL